jgi:DNA segregation ATPase FtsK/SpoIIIE-like protein
MNIYGSLNYDMHGRKRRQKANNKVEFKNRGKITVDDTVSQSAKSHRDLYPSGDCFGRETSKKAENKYTGTYIKGLATMHKSNTVPVGSADPKDYSTMRRN